MVILKKLNLLLLDEYIVVFDFRISVLFMGLIDEFIK